MNKFLKYSFMLIVLAAITFFSYDYYMRNSGISNRIEYEIQKDDTRRDRPVKNFLRKLFN
ncbi:MAG: hypothetical protein ACI8ZM_001803 [Crocinitomix sp.]|jgi:hypothetical protein